MCSAPRTRQFWGPDLDIPANKKFVSGFKKKYGRYPSFYAAQSYDTIMLIKSAVDAVKGDTSKMDEMRAAMKAANYESVRGKYSLRQQPHADPKLLSAQGC